jgi:hypothetical protein
MINTIKIIYEKKDFMNCHILYDQLIIKYKIEISREINKYVLLIMTDKDKFSKYFMTGDLRNNITKLGLFDILYDSICDYIKLEIDNKIKSKASVHDEEMLLRLIGYI